MAKRANSTRRDFLRLIPATAALAAFPTIAVARTESGPSLLPLIEAHRLARNEFARLAEMESELSGQLPEIKIQVGRRKGCADDGSDLWRPIFAHDASNLESFARNRFVLFADGDERERELVEAWKHELRLSRRRARYVARKIGLDAVRRQYDEASALEEKLLTALVLQRPQSPSEAAAKRAYFAAEKIRRHELSCSEVILTGIMADLGCIDPSMSS